jgi:type IV pilus assembly protein PilC
MKKFKYRAMKADGTRISGDFDGNSRDEVMDMITSNGYYPLMVEEVSESTKIEFNFRKKATTKDIAILCRQLYTMIDAGVSINNSLNILANNTTNKNLKKVLYSVEDSVKKGEMLSESMKRHKDVFPTLLIAMMESGEISGNLDTMLLRMSIHYEKETKLNNKIKSAMTYPAMLSIVAISSVMFIMTFVMPTFIEMFEVEGVKLPLFTKILLAISGFLSNHSLIALLFLIIIYVGFSYYKKSEHGVHTISSLKLKAPVIGKLNKKIIVSRFARTLSTLAVSGVSLIQGLPLIAEIIGNKVVEDALMKVREEVAKGESLSDPIKESGIFPEMLSYMITIGEEAGQLDDILNKTADFYDEEVEQAIQTTTALIEPLLIVTMSIVIGFIIISILLPMFDMYTKI